MAPKTQACVSVSQKKVLSTSVARDPNVIFRSLRKDARSHSVDSSEELRTLRDRIISRSIGDSASNRNNSDVPSTALLTEREGRTKKKKSGRPAMAMVDKSDDQEPTPASVIHVLVPSTGIKLPGWKQKTALRELAARYSGMAIQYRAMYHIGSKPIRDHNARINQKIMPGTLVVQSRFMCVSGNGGGCTYSFWKWKLPGNIHILRKSAHISIYKNTRPRIYDDEAIAVDFKENAHPWLILDPSLKQADRQRIIAFVTNADAGRTPMEFFVKQHDGAEPEPMGLVTAAKDTEQQIRPTSAKSLRADPSPKQGDTARSMNNDKREPNNLGEMQAESKSVLNHAEAEDIETGSEVPFELDGHDESTDGADLGADDNIAVEVAAKENHVPTNTADKIHDEASGTRLCPQKRERTSQNINMPRGSTKTPSTKEKRKQQPASTTKRESKVRCYGKRSTWRRQRPMITFSVPKSAEAEYFGLIEGVGGGEEELLRVKRCGRAELNTIGSFEDLPHRGRMLELPGHVMSGAWTAELVTYSDGKGSSYPPALRDRIEDLRDIRLALRHEDAKSFGALRDILNNDSHNDDRNVLTVSVINPSTNRVSSFEEQSVLLEDEIKALKLKAKGNVKGTSIPFIASVSIVAFEGFTSASEASTKSDSLTSKLLGRCKTLHTTFERNKATCNELLCVPSQVPRKSKDQSNVGVSFPCKLQFVDSYSILVGQKQACGPVVALDVIFCGADDDGGSVDSSSSSTAEAHAAKCHDIYAPLSEELLAEHTKRCKLDLEARATELGLSKKEQTRTSPKCVKEALSSDWSNYRSQNKRRRTIETTLSSNETLSNNPIEEKVALANEAGAEVGSTVPAVSNAPTSPVQGSSMNRPPSSSGKPRKVAPYEKAATTSPPRKHGVNAHTKKIGTKVKKVTFSDERRVIFFRHYSSVEQETDIRRDAASVLSQTIHESSIEKKEPCETRNSPDITLGIGHNMGIPTDISVEQETDIRCDAASVLSQTIHESSIEKKEPCETRRSPDITLGIGHNMGIPTDVFKTASGGHSRTQAILKGKGGRDAIGAHLTSSNAKPEDIDSRVLLDQFENASRVYPRPRNTDGVPDHGIMRFASAKHKKKDRTMPTLESQSRLNRITPTAPIQSVPKRNADSESSAIAALPSIVKTSRTVSDVGRVIKTPKFSTMGYIEKNQYTLSAPSSTQKSPTHFVTPPPRGATECKASSPSQMHTPITSPPILRGVSSLSTQNQDPLRFESCHPCPPSQGDETGLDKGSTTEKSHLMGSYTDKMVVQFQGKMETVASGDNSTHSMLRQGASTDVRMIQSVRQFSCRCILKACLMITVAMCILQPVAFSRIEAIKNPPKLELSPFLQEMDSKDLAISEELNTDYSRTWPLWSILFRP